MSDQCKHCTARGDLKECMSLDCSQHDSWFGKQMIEERDRYKDAAKIMENIIELEDSGLMCPERLIEQTNKARYVLELW